MEGSDIPPPANDNVAPEAAANDNASQAVEAATVEPPAVNQAAGIGEVAAGQAATDQAASAQTAAAGEATGDRTRGLEPANDNEPPDGYLGDVQTEAIGTAESDPRGAGQGDTPSTLARLGVVVGLTVSSALLGNVDSATGVVIAAHEAVESRDMVPVSGAKAAQLGRDGTGAQAKSGAQDGFGTTYQTEAVSSPSGSDYPSYSVTDAAGNKIASGNEIQISLQNMEELTAAGQDAQTLDTSEQDGEERLTAEGEALHELSHLIEEGVEHSHKRLFKKEDRDREMADALAELSSKHDEQRKELAEQQRSEWSDKKEATKDLLPEERSAALQELSVRHSSERAAQAERQVAEYQTRIAATNEFFRVLGVED